MLLRMLLYVILPILFLIAYIVACVTLPTESIDALTAEMGPIENIGTLMFLAAGIVGLVLFFRSRGKAPRVWRFGYLLYAVAALFVAGEEVSWGQHIIYFRSPEYFRQHSKQSEANLHNLYGDTMSRSLQRVAQIAVPIVAVVTPLVIFAIDRRAFTPGHWPFYTLPLWEVAAPLLLADLCYFIRKFQWFGIDNVNETTEVFWGWACLVWIAVLAVRVLKQPPGPSVESVR